MISEESLTKLRGGLIERSIEHAREVSTYIKRKANIIDENLKKENACYLVDNDTYTTLSSLLSMYEDQVRLRAMINILDDILIDYEEN